MTTPPQRGGRTLWFVMASMATFMAAVDMTVVAVALPAIVEGLNASLVSAAWTVTASNLVQVVMMPLAGRLAESLGRWRVFVTAVAIFAAGSLLCALAPTVEVLIACRALQALGAGALGPSAMGIISDLYPERRAQAIGLFTSVWPVGGVIGPVLGGALVAAFGWRGVFMISPVVGAVVLALAIRRLGTDRPLDPGALRVDFVAIALFTAAMLLVLLAITDAGTSPGAWQAPPTWVMAAAGVGLFAAFARRTWRARHPVVDLRLVVRRPFLEANAYAFTLGVGLFGFSTYIPFFAVTVYGLGAFESGAILTPRGVAMVLVSVLTSLLMLRYSYRLPMVSGMLLMAASILLMAFGDLWFGWALASLGAVAWLAVVNGLSGIGMGLASPSGNNSAIDLAPDRVSEISGLRSMFHTIGGIFGVAAVALVLSFFADKATTLVVLFAALAGVLGLISVPLAMLIPDRAAERRRARSCRAAESAAAPRRLDEEQVRTTP